MKYYFLEGTLDITTTNQFDINEAGDVFVVGSANNNICALIEAFK